MFEAYCVKNKAFVSSITIPTKKAVEFQSIQTVLDFICDFYYEELMAKKRRFNLKQTSLQVVLVSN